jgi:hypothetical protein
MVSKSEFLMVMMMWGQFFIKVQQFIMRLTHSYQLTGAGGNVWFTHDEFQFSWKKMKGDFILQARGTLLGAGVEAHRKFGWMIRTSLDSTSAMVCAALHGKWPYLIAIS